MRFGAMRFDAIDGVSAHAFRWRVMRELVNRSIDRASERAREKLAGSDRSVNAARPSVTACSSSPPRRRRLARGGPPSSAAGAATTAVRSRGEPRGEPRGRHSLLLFVAAAVAAFLFLRSR
jgi:hypothetical protein